MDETAELIKELSEVIGVPGHEAPVRSVIRRHLRGHVTVAQDRLGSIICRKDGAAKDPKVMLAAHMDEIGFMVKLITKDGFIKFVPLGGWWDQTMLAQRVTIKTTKGDVPGVLGAKPPHLIKLEERSKMVPKSEMYIDVGATNEDEVKALGIQPGDPIIPFSPFTVLRDGAAYLGKAWDDRLGCAVFIDVIKALADESHPNSVFAVGTVQEEVGLRGATTSVYLVQPDVAIVLETDIAGDVPGIKPEESQVKLGGGPSLLVFDAGMIPNLRLRDLVIRTAKENDIPLQFSAMEGGRTDGGMIQLHDQGVPSIVIGVPVRHIHSHTGIFHRADYDRTVRLVIEVIKKLDVGKVEECANCELISE